MFLVAPVFHAFQIGFRTFFFSVYCIYDKLISLFLVRNIGNANQCFCFSCLSCDLVLLAAFSSCLHLFSLPSPIIEYVTQ